MLLQTLFLFGSHLALAFGDIIVDTPNGKIRGRAIQSPSNRTFYAFLGIPYGKPPVGSLRFQAPQKAESWDGILNATTDPNICYQVNSDSPLETEDCLYINVFTSAINLTNSLEKLPVSFGIYGGAFRSGSAGYRNGGPDWFVEQDIVMVSFNYRIGPFGFLSTGDLVMPGNAGLKDQVLALNWTYNNIGVFGGDRERITIQGQSAGGASVTYHLLSKQSKGLFKAALVESGSALCGWAWTGNPQTYTESLAKVVNNDTAVTNTSSANLLNFLQNVTAKEIDNASAILYGNIPLPVIEPEHEGAFITTSMYDLVETGEVSKVPLFIGINSEEEISKAGDINALKVNAQRMDADHTRLVPSNLGQLSAENRTIVGNLIKEAYVGNDTFLNTLGPVVAFTSDTTFTRGIIRFAELYSRYSPVYFYQFSYKGVMGIYNDSIQGADNVAHGEEGHYLSVTRSGSFDNTKLENFPPNDVLTHFRLLEIWTNFIKYQNPTPYRSTTLSNITWPVATPDKFFYININQTLEIKDTPKSPRYNMWRDVFETYGVAPLIIY